MGFLFYGHGSTRSAESRVRDGLVQSYPYKHNLVPSVFSLSTRNVRRVVKVTFSSSRSVKSLISQVFTKWNATSHLNNYENLSIKLHTTKWIGGNYFTARQLKAWSTYMRHVWGARMKQWWKHTPPTHVARVQLPESTPYSMWVKFVVDSLPCSERFLSRYSNFPLSSKPNTSKFQFDLERKDMLNSYVLQFGFNFLFFFFGHRRK